MHTDPVRRPRQRRISISTGYIAFDQNIAVAPRMQLPGLWLTRVLRRQHRLMRLPTNRKFSLAEPLNHGWFTNDSGHSLAPIQRGPLGKNRLISKRRDHTKTIAARHIRCIKHCHNAWVTCQKRRFITNFEIRIMVRTANNAQ